MANFLNNAWVEVALVGLYSKHMESPSTWTPRQREFSLSCANE